MLLYEQEDKVSEENIEGHIHDLCQGFAAGT